MPLPASDLLDGLHAKLKDLKSHQKRHAPTRSFIPQKQTAIPRSLQVGGTYKENLTPVAIAPNTTGTSEISLSEIGPCGGVSINFALSNSGGAPASAKIVLGTLSHNGIVVTLFNFSPDYGQPEIPYNVGPVYFSRNIGGMNKTIRQGAWTLTLENGLGGGDVQLLWWGINIVP